MENTWKSRCLPDDPFWLRSTDWSSSIQKKYTVPRKSMEDILKEDDGKLDSIHRSESISEQFKDLKTCNAKMSVIQNEDSFPFSFDQSTQQGDSRPKGEEEEAQEEATFTLSPQEENEDGDTEIVSIADEPANKSNPSTIDTSKGKFEKTHEAKHYEKTGSSLKESDDTSKESDFSSKGLDNGSEENKPLEMPIVKYFDYDELFIPLALRLNKTNKDENKPSELPQWRTEAEMNYNLSTKVLVSVLEADQRRLNNFEQPRLVQEQLQVLLNEIDNQEQADASLIDDSSTNNSSCENGCRDTTSTSTTTAVLTMIELPTESSGSRANDQNVKSVQAYSIRSNQESKNEVAVSKTMDSMNIDTALYEKSGSEDVTLTAKIKDLKTIDIINKEPSSCPRELIDVVMLPLQGPKSDDLVMSQNKVITDVAGSLLHGQESTNVEMSRTRTQEFSDEEKTFSLSKDSENGTTTLSQTWDLAPSPLSPHSETSFLSATAAKKSSKFNKSESTQVMDDVFEKLFLTPETEEKFNYWPVI